MHCSCLLELVDGDFGQSEMADLAVLDQLSHGADRVRDRHVGIDAVKVVQVDNVDAQAGQRRLAVAADMVGPTVQAYAVVVADDAELCGHRDGLAVPGQRSGDEPLVVSLAIAHRGVQQCHAEFERPADRADRLVVVGLTIALRKAHTSHAEC